MNNSTNIQSIIEGCLLGDGYIEINKNGKNGSFRYRSSSLEHVKFVHKHLKKYCSDGFSEPKRSETYDHRTNKTYVSYYFYTLTNEIFTVQQKRFYIDRKKIVPLDLRLNEISTLFWYIGDGELEKNNGYIKLHTNSFTKKENEFLCEQLSNFKSKLQKKEYGIYLVTIPRKCVSNFLDYIGTCPINDYKHRWNEVPYKNKNIEINGINYYSEYYENIEKDFETNEYSIYQLHKKYGVPIKCIKNRFNKNNIKWKPKKLNKRIVQYDNDGIINVWESGSEIVSKLGFNASAISECCRGKRKKYKGYYWKFK